MFDEVQKVFVRCFIQYLKENANSQVLSIDTKESIEVAIQCLYAAFEIQPEVEESESNDESNNSMLGNKQIDLFEMFQSLYIERNPESLRMADAIKNEGNRLMKEGKYSEALLQYNRAITFDPKNPIYYCNRAAAYIRLGDNERAITDCKLAIVYNPSYGKAYGRLGIAYSNMSKYSEAQKAYEKAIELEPENQDYRNNLEIARAAHIQVSNNAIPNLSEGISAMLSNPDIRNMFSSAEIDLEQLQNISQNPVIMNAIGQLFSGMQGGTNAPSNVPLIQGDVLQLFQSFANQLSSTNASSRNRNENTDESSRQPRNKEPPSSEK